MLFLIAFVYAIDALPGLLLLPWIDLIGTAHKSVHIVYGLPLLANTALFVAIGALLDRYDARR